MVGLFPIQLVNLRVWKVWEAATDERAASPLCRTVKHIEAWLNCTGQLLWHTNGPPCQTHRCAVMIRVCVGILSKACPRLAPVISVSLPLSSAFCSCSCLPHLKSNQICHDSRAALACSGVTGGTDWPLGCKFDFRLWTWCKSFSLIRSDYTKQLRRAKLKVTDGGWRRLSM